MGQGWGQGTLLIAIRFLSTKGIVGILLSFFSFQLWAEDDAYKRSRCQHASEQLRAVRAHQRDKIRIRVALTLLDEIKDLSKDLKQNKGLSKSRRKLTKRCFETKVDSFEMNLKNASPQAYGDVKFNTAVGEYAYLNNFYKKAYDFFSKALGLSPKEHDLRWKCYVSLKLWYLSGASPFSKVEYIRISQKFLEPLAYNAKVNSKIRSKALEHLAERDEWFDKPSKVRKHYEMLLGLNPKMVTPLLQWAAFEMRRLDFKKAEKLLDSRLDAYKKDSDTLFFAFEQLYSLQMDLKFEKKALVTLKKMKKRFPKKKSLDALVARSLVKNKRFDEAKKYLNKAKGESEGRNILNVTEAMLELEEGRKQSEKGRFDLAEKSFIRALKKQPSNQEAMVGWLNALEGNGKNKEALKQLRKVFGNLVKNQEILGLHARLLARSANPKEALESCDLLKNFYRKTLELRERKACSRIFLASGRSEDSVSIGQGN